MKKSIRIQSTSKFIGTLVTVFVINGFFSETALACPAGWFCKDGLECPPIENCLPLPSIAPPRASDVIVPIENEPPQEELPSSPIEEVPVVEIPVESAPIEEIPVESTPIEEIPVESTPVEEIPVESTPIEEIPIESTPIEEIPAEDQPAPENPSTPANTPPSHQPPQQPIIEKPDYNTREADALRERADESLDDELEEIIIIGGYRSRTKKDYGSISSQIGDLEYSLEYDTDDGGDPRDTPPPVIYGEEIDQVVGIVLKRVSDRWVPEHKNRAYVTAKIYVPDPAREKVWLPSDSIQRKMEITFIARSNEKGKALNAKLDSDPQDSPDLYFNPERNKDTECRDDPTGKGHFGTCKTNSPHNQYTFAINSDDFGGFSRLDISCEGCVQLTLVVGVYPEAFQRNKYWPVAVEEPDQEKRAVFVPNDVNKNQISDGYPPDKLENMHADEDSESVPKGNGIDGDGLSAYEEYRGFINRFDNHKRTDWSKKTLMVENLHHLTVYKFERASGLEIVEIESDGHENRIVNFNSGHANIVDQHGVKLKMYPSLDDKFAGYCFGGCKRPKSATWVTVKPSYRNDSEVIAHELGHSVGMVHHGNLAWPEEEEIRAMTGGLGDLLPGRVHSGPSLCGKNLPAKFKVGTKGDQGSGSRECIMKYGHYHYVYEQSGGDYDCMPYTSPASIFDDSPVGTGPNGSNRTAGNASVGSCLSQTWISSK